MATEELKEFTLEPSEPQYLTEEDVRALLGSFTTDLIREEAGTIAKDLQIFTEAGTWEKPKKRTLVQVICIGAGGGGSSGRRGASGTVRAGGTGGGGASIQTKTFLASDLSATVAITVATGGAGGAAVTADNTNGNVGSNGSGSTAFGSLVVAYNGGGGEEPGANANGMSGGGGASQNANASTTTGGAPAAAKNGIGLQGVHGTTTATETNGLNGDFGGGSGGGNSAKGGSSLWSC